jgi:predicted transcriptional regulator
MSTLGELKEARRLRGWDQAALAAAAGVTELIVAQIEDSITQFENHPITVRRLFDALEQRAPTESDAFRLSSSTARRRAGRR